MISAKTQIRVRYADTDQMKIVYHGKYLEYFEQSRSELIRSIGLPYSQLETNGILLPVIEAYAKYKKPALYDDLITVEATVTELPQATLKILYKVFIDDEKNIIAEGYTVHSFLNATTRRPTRAPSYFVKLFNDKI